jgi:hypothetical protein
VTGTAGGGVRRDLAIGLSLATLWFIGVWSDLLAFLYISDRYPVGALPCWNDYAAVVANVCVLGIAFALIKRLWRSAAGPLRTAGEWLLIASLIVPLNAIRNHFNTPAERIFAALPPRAAQATAVLAIVVMAIVVIRWRAAVVRGLGAGLLILFPLVLVTFAQAGWAVLQGPGGMRCGSAGAELPRLPIRLSARVLWIVYDELEERATFESRPDDLALPELDRLRRESFSASNAVPPADRTERSMPSFISGAIVEDAALVGRNELRLTVRGHAEPRRWTADHTVFARARPLGVNSAVAGFFLPYCALIGEALTSCSWQPCVTCGRLVGAFGGTVTESMANQVSELAPRYGRRRHLEAYRALQAAAIRIARDPSIGLALLHIPVPHDPPIYDRARGEMSLVVPPGRGYFDNLALVDRSLGELRRAMEESGSWKSTTVVLFGDHGRRVFRDGVSIADPRVPFIVKLAGQRQPLAYEKPFNLVLVHDLTIELLSGRMTNAQQVAAWLDAHRADWPASLAATHSAR